MCCLVQLQSRVEQEIAHWQATNHKQLTIFGTSFSSLVEEMMLKQVHEKENQKQLRVSTRVCVR